MDSVQGFGSLKLQIGYRNGVYLLCHTNITNHMQKSWIPSRLWPSPSQSCPNKCLSGKQVLLSWQYRQIVRILCGSTSVEACDAWNQTEISRCSLTIALYQVIPLVLNLWFISLSTILPTVLPYKKMNQQWQHITQVNSTHLHMISLSKHRCDTLGVLPQNSL
jgi:hypothetical protein